MTHLCIMHFPFFGNYQISLITKVIIYKIARLYTSSYIHNKRSQELPKETFKFGIIHTYAI